jgi:predicted P-loop ATPase
LTDTTGNRRYWPVRCRAIDVVGIQRDRDQLWAEAAARYAGGERWWLEGAEVVLAEAQQADREAIDPWEQPLQAWLEGRAANAPAFSMADVLAGALALGRAEQHQANATRVGKLLARLGWRTRAMKDPTTHKVVRLYTRTA